MTSNFNNELKLPKTYEEQILKLKSKNIRVEDEQLALKILKKVNYYRLSAYLLTYKSKSGLCDGVSISDIFELYKFDKSLRWLLMPVLEDIEIAFRTHIAYLLAHKYGALGYKESKNFNNKEYHTFMLESFYNEVDRSDEIFVKHHKKQYDGNFPIWVIIELSSFGSLSKIYNNLLDEDKEQIAKDYYNTNSGYVKSWLHSLSVIRNRCAHYGRLYNKRLTVSPRLFKSDRKKGIDNNTLFAALCVMRILSNDYIEWKNFVNELENLFVKHENIDISYIGFPRNWKDFLLE